MAKNKKKNTFIDFILMGIIILSVTYIIDSNKLFQIGNKYVQASQITDEYENKQNLENTNEIGMNNEKNNILNEENANIAEGEGDVQNGDKTTNNEQNEEKSGENGEQGAQNGDQSQGENQNSEEGIPAKMGGYDVLGRLVIDKINVSKNILSVSNDNSLKFSVVKLYGPEINTAGNFCICGHNWKGMLKRAKELKVGDTFYLIDRKNLNRVDYEIYNIYSCMPKDLECLEQSTNGKREATLITCNPGGVTRLIIKAKEI